MKYFYIFFMLNLITVNAQITLADWEINDANNPKEDCLTLVGWAGDPNAPVASVVDDPVTTRSGKSAKFVRTSGSSKTNGLSLKWSNNTAQSGFNTNANRFVRFKLYSVDKATFNLDFKIMGYNATAGGNIDRAKFTKDMNIATGEWVDIEIDFSGAAGTETDDNVTYTDLTLWQTEIRLLFDQSVVGSGETYYIDDIQMHSQATLSANSPYSLKAEIYPNPTTGLLHITDVTDMQSISILNLLGQNVKTLKAANTIDVSDLNKGIYFLSTDTGLTRKFIKE